MRDIIEYEKQYVGHFFERYQEKFRRKMVRNVIKNYAQKGDSILEIGCGVNPLFTDYLDEYSFTVIEPAESLYLNACALAGVNDNIVCYQGFFENIADKLGGGMTLLFVLVCYMKWKTHRCCCMI